MLDLAVSHLISTANPLIKRLVHLHEARGRREAGQFIVEGRRAITDFLALGHHAAHLLVRADLTAPDGWPPVTTVSARILERLSQATSPSGYLAVFPIPAPAALIAAQGGLLLADVADPGNLGTLLRTAAAMGVAQVALLGTTDPWSAKTVQATAGALARLQLHLLTPEQAIALATEEAPGCALVVRDGLAPERLARRRRWLVVGGEARGIPPELLAACAERVTLPMPGGTESLNAAIAGAIACYLLMRSDA